MVALPPEERGHIAVSPQTAEYLSYIGVWSFDTALLHEGVLLHLIIIHLGTLPFHPHLAGRPAYMC